MSGAVSAIDAAAREGSVGETQVASQMIFLDVVE
jgi:hypothetical protein